VRALPREPPCQESNSWGQWCLQILCGTLFECQLLGFKPPHKFFRKNHLQISFLLLSKSPFRLVILFRLIKISSELLISWSFNRNHSSLEKEPSTYQRKARNFKNMGGWKGSLEIRSTCSKSIRKVLFVRPSYLKLQFRVAGVDAFLNYDHLLSTGLNDEGSSCSSLLLPCEILSSVIPSLFSPLLLQ
jgi:hypothetical protein